MKRVVFTGSAWFGLSLAMVAAPLDAQGGGPLSAINWLNAGTAGTPAAGAFPVTPPATTPEGAIAVRPLDALRPEAVGLFPAARVGLPADLWGQTPALRLAELFGQLPADMLPALRDLALRLLLAEFAAPLPEPAGASGVPALPAFLMARLDTLIAFGALDQAAALMDAMASPVPALRLRRFDVGLLLGDEHTACAGVLLPEPPIGDVAARIFCLARAGAWPEAEQLMTEASGQMDPYMADLLTQFLHNEETLPGAATLIPPPPGTPTPLALRLREVTGESAPTTGLPVAFAHSDLRGTLGWRAQIDAAERLVRVGALPANRLLGLYTERLPAASGGIWERVRLLQRLDVAVRDGNASAASEALVAGWPLVSAAELEVPIADLFAAPLSQMPLTPEAAGIAWRMALLTDAYETAALALDPATATPEDLFLAAVARGIDPMGGAMPGELAAAVALAFGPTPPLPEPPAGRAAEGRLGEDILTVLIRLGGPGDPRALAEGLASLRALGLEDIARRTALQSLLLTRNG